MRFGFKDLMIEGSGLIVISFGRFNPPTIGHEKVIEKVKEIAGTAPFRIYPSHSTGDKDPLPHAKKIAYMRKMFPKYKRNIVADKEAKTVIHIAEKLYKEGFTDLIMVAGSDRVKEFDTLLQRYNGKPDRKGKIIYDFNSLKVVNAGQRDPDAEGVTGMSASKMRKAAADGDFDSFKMGIPNTIKDTEKKKLYLDVRKHMGIRERRDMGEMNTFEELRDKYLVGKIWKTGDLVEANGYTGKVVNRGTNYLSFADEDGKIHKVWLHEISIDERNYRKEYEEAETIVEGLSMMVKDPKTKKKVQFGGQKEYGQKIQIDKTVYNVMGITKMQVLVLHAPLSKEKRVLSKQEIETGLKSGNIKITDKGSVWQPEEVDLGERNYKKEYDNYHSKPEQVERRSSRNKARRAMGDKAVKGKDVGHKDNNPLNNEPDNLRNEDPSKNRREPRLREANVPDIKKGDTIILSKGKRKYSMAGITDPKTTLPAESDKMVVQKITKSKRGRKAHLTYHDTKKRGGFAIYLDQMPDFMSVKKEEVELDEMAWYAKVMAKIDQLTHPRGYDKIVKDYVAGMKNKEHKKHPSAWASELARQHRMPPRSLILYINKLVQKGALPKDLNAEYIPEQHSFKRFVNQIQEKKIEGLENKAEKSKYTYATLKKVYDRGMGAYKTNPGSVRPNVTSPQQWAMARVNSFLKGGHKQDDDLKESDYPTVTFLKKKNKKEPEYKNSDISEKDGPCWDGYKQVGMKKKKGKDVPNCVPEETDLNEWGEVEEAAEYQGRKVTLNKPTKGDVKKSKVYVKNAKGNVVKVEFGDPDMQIQKDIPSRRKSFRARHNCDNPGPKWKARYWSCKAW